MRARYPGHPGEMNVWGAVTKGMALLMLALPQVALPHDPPRATEPDTVRALVR